MWLGSSAQRSEEFLQWLHRNGRYVTSLDLQGFSSDLTELPCRQLRQLVVSNDTDDTDTPSVQLGPSSSHPGVLHSCSGLTLLKLRSCEIVDSPNSLSALSAVPALQHLELSEFHGDDDSDDLGLPSSILQLLTQLTFLEVGPGIDVTAESLQHISGLQHLQEFRLAYPSVYLCLSPSSTPGLAQLTGLHTLKLSRATLDAAVLQDYTQLQQFKLQACTLSSADSAAVLLSVLGRQVQLQQLELLDLLCEWPAASAFTALAASSRLQKLYLLLADLPAGVWQAVFNRQQQLPQLQFFRSGRFGDEEYDNGPVKYPAETDFSSADLSRLVDCCPGLQSVKLDIQADVQLAVLSQLTALTALSVWRANQVSVKSLSGLARLEDLSLYVMTPFSAPSLLHLTALQRLTSLEVSIHFLVYLDDEADIPEHLHSHQVSIAGDV